MCCTGPGDRRGPWPGMTVWERKGLSALAGLGPGPLGSHEAHAPRNRYWWHPDSTAMVNKANSCHSILGC